ncbi:malonyl-ACP O-methyltransferase BioC [Cysteiniphilum halobium]|uniref:hypothetical protein n=1 Tax=Cysteiniphilum halobium TaxID=2219059 RepID=UPI000E646DDD|nr:hypothetical protein [Cysteiniphilum halobium]
MFDQSLFHKKRQQYERRFVHDSFIKNEIAERLLDKLSFIKLNPEHIFVEGLDAHLAVIKEIYPNAVINNHTLDKEVSYDVIISHCKIQQVANINVQLRNWHKQLKPQGVLVFTSFGSTSLQEIKKAWQLIDGMVHINQMLDMHDMGDVLNKEQYQSVVMDAETIKFQYETIKTLLGDIRALNEPLADTKMRKTLIGKNRWQNFCQRLEKLGLSASYEVFYGYGYKGNELIARKETNSEAMIRFDQLKDALKHKK